METLRPSQPWGDKQSSFQMIDVSQKTATARRAQAQGDVHLTAEAYRALREKKNPKGDVLALAEVAAIMAAKRTSETIPLCHPLPLDQVKVSFVCDDDTHSVRVYCETATTAKTGVEMEALAGVNGALLTIYDLSKFVSPAITLSGIRLNVKEGGKTGRWVHPAHAEQALPTVAELTAVRDAYATAFAGVRVAVLTISDRCSQGSAEDRSGPALSEALRARGASVLETGVVPDGKLAIQQWVCRQAYQSNADLIITTGGTGLGPRDLTPEALEEIYTRRIPGLGELLRAQGARRTSMAWLGRGEAGLVGRTLVIALPGSPKAVSEGLEALEGLIPHALEIIGGGAHA